MFSLGGWSPLLPTNSPGFVVLRIPTGAPSASLRDSHPLWWRLPTPSSQLGSRPVGPTTPPGPCGPAGLGSSRLARHYYGNLRLISLRRATEMFQFAHCPPPAYVFSRWCPDITLDGLPHSDSQGFQRLGIHRVLCRACTAACSPPLSSTSLLQARALPLLLLFALGKIEVIVIYFCNAVCKGTSQVTLTTGKWKPAQRVSLTRPTRSATPLNPCFPCSPLRTRTDLGAVLARLPQG